MCLSGHFSMSIHEMTRARQPEVDLSDASLVIKFLIKSFAAISLAAVNVTGKVTTPGEQWEAESSRTYAQNPNVVLKEK